ncbi:UvrD-helicase domain-containing protein, partial [Hungatella hominis]
MDWEREWERLNPYQREAVTDENKACLVSANVGSGKTTVLTAKILYLHEVKHVSYR